MIHACQHMPHAATSTLLHTLHEELTTPLTQSYTCWLRFGLQHYFLDSSPTPPSALASANELTCLLH